jgi:hypothetical protein
MDGQMKMFIQEMTLLVCNLGDLDTEDAQNDALPYLLDIQRVTVRRARAYVKDLLRGHKGEVSFNQFNRLDMYLVCE